ncbi:hypothetical protein TRSC58_07340 [Trypanosoma rangeli SC58]|uniref:Uncharacterized protein n=1 Tax=Trypanosoma rangeli SC58 TaxID=429131 RepID=A0A061IVN6_TRYRA|nr:hypothetical protein TRSC58_07340 [Trypanosoma rangeli SC58]
MVLLLRFSCIFYAFVCFLLPLLANHDKYLVCFFFFFFFVAAKGGLDGAGTYVFLVVQSCWRPLLSLILCSP